MTDTNDEPCRLPPIAWQRGTGWGRDVTAYARAEDHRIADIEMIDILEIASPRMSTIEAIVLMSRYRSVFGSLETAMLPQSRTLDADQWDRMITGRYHEIDIANALSAFIMEGSRIISLGPKLVSQARRDTDADLELAAMSKGGPAFYVHAEGTSCVSYDGRPLDGFLVSFEDENETGDIHLHVTPMSPGEPVVDAVKAPTPTMCLKPGKGDVRISDAIRSAADVLMAHVDKQSRKILEDDGPQEEKTLQAQRRELTTIDEIEAASKQADIMIEQAEQWARLIGTAINCLVNRGPEAVPGYPPEAPADLVDRVNKGGAGARKAEQRLIASGYPRWTRYEIGEPAVANLPAVDADSQETVGEPMAVDAGDMAVATIADESASTDMTDTGKARRGGPRPDRRKERRQERLGRNSGALKTPAEPAPAPPSEGHAVEPVQPDSTPVCWTPTIAVHDQDLLAELHDTLRRCFKDLPSLDSRNWENAFPPALASMVMRRAKVAQMPRENHDATRRRLAADIRPRLEGLPALLQRLRAEEAANGDRIKAYAMERASIQRDVDVEVAEAAAHPVMVSIAGDDDLARRIMFAGVEREPKYLQDRTVVVRAWRVERTLHLMGIVHDGCLTGFRRLEFDLDDRTVTAFDADADDGDADGLLDALYAPIADAVLGPVDEADAWRHERRPTARRERVAPTIAIPVDVSESEDDVPAAPVVPDAPWTPAEAEFASWETVRQPVPALRSAQFAMAAETMDRNAVARAVLRTLQHDGEAGDVRNALSRHLAAWRGNVPLHLLTTPHIEDDADISGLHDRDGVLVVTDVALVEHASPGLVTGPQTAREAPMCVLYHIRDGSACALIIRPTSDNLINLAQWTAFDVRPSDDESDLAWYVRGAIAAALVERRRPELVGTPMTTLPGRQRADARTAGHREGPRRIVAQVRIRPANMQLAAAAATSWFDAQVARHGNALIEDRRLEGDWTIEHESMDRSVASRWSVTLHVAEDDPGALDVLVRTTLATGVKPRLPTLIREIAAATPTEGPDGRLTVHPRSVRTRSDLNDLLRHLQSNERLLPTLVMTQDRQGQYARDTSDIARQAMGAMNVWLLADHMTYELSDALGQEYRVFGGASRLFQPRFDPDVDPASRHPRIMNDAGVDRAVAELISRATAATTTRYNIPDPLSPTVRVVETPVIDDEPTLPFVGEPLSAREAFPAPTPAASDQVPERQKEAVSDIAPQVEVPSRPEPVPAEEPQDAAPDAINPVVEIEPVAKTETPAATEVAARMAPQVQEAPPARKPMGFLPPITAPMVPAATESEPAAPEATPPVDMDRLVAAVDAAVTRRLADMGIGAIAGTLEALTERVTALASGGGATAAEIGARDAEIQRLREEMRLERETTQELLTEAEAQRQSAMDEVEILRQAFNERRRGELRGTAARQWPDELSGLAEWLEQNVLPNVVITPKAWRAMRKVRYTDMERLCSTLQLLDGAYVDMRAGEEGARQRWEDGLKELRIENRKQSQMGKGIRGGSEYRFEHEGTRWDMDFHLRGTESVYNEHDRLLRIYYAYDKERGRVLIGHMPTHLTTIDS